MKNVKQVVSAVCCVMEGALPNAVLAEHRGSTRASDLRAVSMLIWRDLHPSDARPCYRVIGEAFHRDRRNVARGIERIARKGLPTAEEKARINDILK